MGVGLHLGFKDFGSDKKPSGTFNRREGGYVGAALGKLLPRPQKATALAVDECG